MKLQFPSGRRGVFLVSAPIVIAIIYLVFHFLSEGDAGMLTDALNAAFATAAALLAFLLWWTTRKTVSKEIDIWLVAAFALLALAEITYSAYTELLDVDVEGEIGVSLADFFWMAAYVVLLVVLFRVVKKTHVVKIKGAIPLTAVFWVVMAPLLGYIILYSFSGENSWLENLVWSFYYPVLDAVMLNLLILLIWAFRKGLLEDCWLFVAVSIVLMTTGDLLYTLFEAAGIYHVGTLPDIFYIGTYVLLTLGMGILLFSRALTAPTSFQYDREMIEGPKVISPRKTYIVWESDTRRSYDMLMKALDDGMEGLVVAEKTSNAIRPTFGLRNVQVLTLSNAPGPDSIRPSDLGMLTDRLVRFLESGSRKVVLLDGFKTMASFTDFRKALMAVQHVEDVVAVREALMIVPIDKKTLSAREAALISEGAAVVAL
jgi:hypothetical protein